MKYMKRIASVVLAMVMVLAMSMPVMAAEDKATITMNVPKGQEDHQYTVYQVFTGDVSGTEKPEGEGEVLSNVKYGQSYVPEGKKVGDPVGKTELDAIKDAESYAASIKEKVNNPIGTLNSENEFSLEVDQGYYLIVDDTNVKIGEGDAFSAYIVEVVGAASITPKSDVPSSEKKVKDINDSENDASDWQDSADYDIGDTIEFKLTGTLPANYGSFEVYKLTFHDKESGGLDFNADSVKVYADNTLVKGEGLYTVVTEGLDDGCTFEIQIPDVKKLSTDLKNGSEIRVEYTSTLNETGVVFGNNGNPNTMHMEYSNNPYNGGTGTSTTPEDKVVVFTYKTVIDKVDQDGKSLAGAEFTLYKYDSYDEDAETSGDYTGYVVKGKLEEDENHQFTLKGLDDGQYILKESKTPDGYNTMPDVKFTVTAEHDKESTDPKLTNLNVVVDEPEGFEFSAAVEDGKITSTKKDNSTHSVGGGEIYAEVVNQKGTTLPETGGIGTTIFYVVGAALVIGAGVLLVVKKRMSKEQ